MDTVTFAINDQVVKQLIADVQEIRNRADSLLDKKGHQVTPELGEDFAKLCEEIGSLSENLAYAVTASKILSEIHARVAGRFYAHAETFGLYSGDDYEFTSEMGFGAFFPADKHDFTLPF